MPKKVIDTMPGDMFLDGELWFGRDNFQESMKLSHRVDESLIDWEKFKYMVFDIPNQQATYRERYHTLGRIDSRSLDRRLTVDY